MTYQDVQPSRRGRQGRRPVAAHAAWGAGQGVGRFPRRIGGLTQEQVELVAAWVEGGASHGAIGGTCPTLQPRSRRRRTPGLVPGVALTAAPISRWRRSRLTACPRRACTGPATMRVTAVLA